MRIAVIGTGYVGLVSGACLAELGHEVAAMDRDLAKIAALRRGEVPIHEPGLDAFLARNAAAGRIRFTASLAEALEGAEAVLVAVGTPSRKGDGRADLSYVRAAARDVAGAARGPLVVVVKSTVPVGTNREVAQLLRELRPELDLAVASNPEFLREGAAIGDFMAPDRIVLGTDGTPRARAALEAMYAPLARQGAALVWTDLESAEMIKCAANAFLATKITFINEVAALCERVGADVAHVAQGLGLDPRIGPRFLQAGPGYGGSCFPKDTSAFAVTGRDAGVPLKLTEAVIEVNESVKRRMVDKLAGLADGSLAGKTVLVLGVTFKPDTDDMREAPALTILPALMGRGARVRVVDPKGRKEGEALLPGVTWHDDPVEAAQGAHLAVLLTEWPQFRDLDLARLARAMAEPRLADLRNLWDPAEVRAAGFTAYDAVGRPGWAAPAEGVRAAE